MTARRPPALPWPATKSDPWYKGRVKAILLNGAKNLESGNIQPQELGPRDVRIKVRTMGICGSDVEYYLHNRIGPFVPQGPLALGHELAGTVVEVGPEVDQSIAGARVAIDPSIPCRVCEFCRIGRHNLCTNLRFVGTAATVPHIPGGLAEEVVVPAANCFVIPDELSFGEGACLEPLSVAVHAALRPGSIAGAHTLVSGGGTIGQFVALVARAFGAASVTVSDLQSFRREFALGQGADAAVDPIQEGDLAEASERVGGFDVVFEASGAPPAIRSALDVVKRGGTIVQIGSIAEEVQAPLNVIMTKELRYMGTFRYGDIYPISLNLLSTRRVDVRPLISATFPVDDVVEAFELAAARSNSVKVQVEHA